MRRNTSETASGCSQEPSSRVNTLPVSFHASPHWSRSRFCRARCARSTATVAVSSPIVAALLSVLGADSYGVQPSVTISVDTVSSPPSRFTSVQPRPIASPRRRPRKPIRWNSGASRSPSASAWSRNTPNCCGVHTMTEHGFSPLSRHRRTRSSAHSSGFGRLPASNSTCAAGLKVISPRAIAAFSAVRSVRRTACRVAGPFVFR